jgi:hypothetical protein
MAMRSRADRGGNQPGVARDRIADPGVFGQLTRREFGAGVLIVLFAMAMRLYGLGARPLFWEDELGLWEYILTGNNAWVPQEAPLYSWLQFIWMWWIQTPTANTMRLLSIAFGVLDVFAAFVLGRLIGGVRVGLLAATLLSVSPMALALAHEVRPYTLFILASAFVLSCFVSAWERNTPRTWLGYGLALTIVLLTHLLAIQLCVALGITVVAAIGLERHRPQILVRFFSFAATSVVFGLFGIAWVGSLPDRGAVLTGPYARGPLDFIQGSITSLGGGVESQIPVAVTLAVLAAVGLVVLARRQPVHAILLSSVIAASCLISYATMEQMSLWGWTNWQRYLAHLLVPYLVLIAIGTLWLARAVTQRLSGPPASVLAGAITLVPLLLVVPGTRRWLDSPDYHPNIEKISRYSTFACRHQHDVLGFIFTELLHVPAPGISTAFTRQYYGYDQVRHDSLATYSLGPRGVRKLVKRPGRGNIGTVPEYVRLSRPPPDGRYIVFPPAVGCEKLAGPPFQGVDSSVTVSGRRSGLICHIRFQQ